MGNVSMKTSKKYRRNHSKTHKCNSNCRHRHHKRGGMLSPKEQDPRTIIREKMKANVTRRRMIHKSNSDTPSGKTRTKRKFSTLEPTIEEEYN